MYIGYIKYGLIRTKSEEIGMDGGDYEAFVELGVAYEVRRMGKQLNYPTKGLPCQIWLLSLAFVTLRYRKISPLTNRPGLGLFKISGTKKTKLLRIMQKARCLAYH